VHFWSPKRSGAEQRSAQEYESDLQRIRVTVLRPLHGNWLWPILLNVYDAAIFEFWHCAEWAIRDLRRVQPWTYLIIDSVDVHFLREEAGLRQGIGDPLSVAERKQREIAAYREGDCVVVVTHEDRRALEAVGGIKRQVVLPNITVSHCRPPLTRGADLLFVGGFLHAPNADGVTWFVNEVLPLVTAEVPSVRLTIVGSNASEEVRILGGSAGVDFIGYVEDTGPYLDRAAVSVAPMRFGAGMKGKVTEAMSAGLAVVTTSVGAQGLAAEHGRHLLVGDTAKDFASQIVQLLRQPERAEEIGASAQQYIAALCGFEAVAAKAKNLITPELLRSTPRNLGLRLLTLGLTLAIGREITGFAWRCARRLRNAIARTHPMRG
jgi:glycosyltransferase involved in cell wall biosynthesis